MNENQTINCTVESCKYNDGKEQKCNLDEIVVEPILDCDTQEADESMCASYENENNNWEDENE